MVNFLSHPVVNGFTNAGAIIIATSQLEKMFGVYVDGKEHHYETIIEVCKSAVHYTHWPTFFFGIGSFTLMFVLKKIAPKVPNVLVAVALTTVIAWAIGFQHDTKVDIATIQSDKTRETDHLVQCGHEGQTGTGKETDGGKQGPRRGQESA